MKKGIIRTPADFDVGNISPKKGSPGVYNGEPKYDSRTGSKSQLPEKTYDQPPATKK